jgi:thiol:disulfide interchange protein DsbC
MLKRKKALGFLPLLFFESNILIKQIFSLKGGFMKKVLVLGFCLFLLIVTSVIYAETEQLDLKVQFEKQFPNFKVDSISPTPIDGIYEIIGKEGNQIIYWAPKGDGYLIFGEIWTTKGESLTAKRRQELVMKKISDLDLSKAIKVGKGKTKVITFSDPECPFCKKAYEFLSKRSDITEYVFLLPFHQGSKEKIAYVLCSKDKEKA